MRFATAAFISASLLIAAAPASAGDRASNAGFVKAARCQALAHATELGAVDTTTIDAYVKAQSVRRDGLLQREAKAAALNARQQAASPNQRARLVAERERSCGQWIQPAQIASGGTAGAGSASN